MAKFIYLVTVEVPDETVVLGEEYERWYQDEDNSVGPVGMSQIVMLERLGYVEDYGFEYAVDYSPLPAGKYGMEI